MSSSNEVALYALEETTEYNTVEGTGNFKTVRFIGETLDGTPNTKKSAEIRNDRQSSGQKVVGLNVGGNIVQEMVRDAINDQFLGGAMHDTTNAASAMTADTITIDASAKTLTFSTEDPSATFSVGDFCTLSGFSTSGNNTTVIVSAVTSSVITYVGGADMVNETGGGDEVATRPAYLDIGTTQRSWSIERKYGDLTSKFIDYTGMRINQAELKFEYGDFAGMTFTFAGAGYDALPTTEMTDSRTIDAASTNVTLNASSDVGLVLVDGSEAECGFSSLTVQINNNMQASNKIGAVAACNQRGFEATINVNATMELTDTNTSLMANKLAQTPIEIATFSVDSNGLGYGVHLYAAQLSFSDPSAAQGNQFVSMEMSGVGKVHDTYQRTLRVYLLGTL